MVELLIIFAFVLGVVYFTHQHRQRMTLIKKGEHTGNINISKGTESLRFGIFLIGIAVGFVAGALLENAGLFHNSELAYVTMILLFGGLGLLISHFVEKSKQKDDKPGLNE